MKLYQQKPSLDKNPFRRILMRINIDLFKIHYKIDKTSVYYPDNLTNLEKITIILEDRRFFRHRGYDVFSLARELFKAALLKRHGGASTIDMQFVRTATGFREISIRRKIYEIILSRIIQYRYSKILIIRSYLSCAYFGSHLIGSKKVAQVLYQKSEIDLNLDEAAFLAAMLVYPRPLSPSPEWNSKVLRRARYGMAIHIRNKESFYEFDV